MTTLPHADQSPDARDARGRFQPGQSGNPAGKKPGTLNHATRLKQELEDGEFQVMARKLIGRAKEGDMAALRIMLDRLDPKPRGRAVTLNFPVGASVLERFMSLSMALAAGTVTPDEARTVALVLDLEGRERQRTLNADLALAKNRDAYLPHELAQTAKRFDALFPVSVWNTPKPKPEPEPDLHSACNSEQAAPAEAPTLEPSPSGRGAGEGAEGDALLHSTCNSEQAAPAEAPTLDPSPARGGGEGGGLGRDAPLHSTCNSPLPTPRRRAMSRWRADRADRPRDNPEGRSA